MNYSEIMELARHYCYDCKPKFEEAKAIADYMRPIVVNLDEEHGYLMCLDAKNQLIELVDLYTGTANGFACSPRDIFRAALKNGAVSIIFVHNHPSGDPVPSDEDIEISIKILYAGKIIGIQLLDSVIIGKKTATRHQDFLSMRELELLL